MEPDTAALRCPSCGSEAFLCDRPEHGAATWAFHCRSKPHHNKFGARGTQPPREWATAEQEARRVR